MANVVAGCRVCEKDDRPGEAAQRRVQRGTSKVGYAERGVPRRARGIRTAIGGLNREEQGDDGERLRA